MVPSDSVEVQLQLNDDDVDSEHSAGKHGNLNLKLLTYFVTSSYSKSESEIRLSSKNGR